MTAEQHFASDNNAGTCPEAMQAALAAETEGHAASYGDDIWTERACDKVREVFDTDCEVFFVFNGSAANGLSVATMCQPFHGLICHQHSHVATNECNGPSFLSGGTAMLTTPGENGKLHLPTVESIATEPEDFHHPKPTALSLTQPTEVGTVYSLSEVQAVGALAKRLNLNVHMDGARFANAVAALDVHPGDITWRAGVDVLSFGATKNGLPVGEAVVIFNKKFAKEFGYRAKQAGQIASKMRFISAAWMGMLENDVWLNNARNSNAMAERLANHVEQIGAIEIVFPPQANAVFARIPDAAVKRVDAAGWRFYTELNGISRLMCAWDTTPEVVDRFAADLAEACRVAA